MLYVSISKKDSTATHLIPTYDFYAVYDYVMDVCKNRETASNVANWTDIASVGESYDFEIGTAEIVEE